MADRKRSLDDRIRDMLGTLGEWLDSLLPMPEPVPVPVPVRPRR